jgi:hypothetical protein
MQFRLAGTLHHEPSLYSCYVQTALMNGAMENIAVGIKRHLWTSEDLQIFDHYLEHVNLVAALVPALRGDRAEFNDAIATASTAKTSTGQWDKMFDLTAPMPGLKRTPLATGAAVLNRLSGASTDQSFYNRHIQKIVDTLVGTVPIRPADLAFIEQRIDTVFMLTHYFSAVNMSMKSQIIPLAFRRQDAAAQTRIAGALEQYWLAHHAYPGALTALPPAFSKLDSTLGGSPMHYRLESGGGFLLWSEGWNEINEGGVAPTRSSDSKSLDWVWGMAWPR